MFGVMVRENGKERVVEKTGHTLSSAVLKVLEYRRHDEKEFPQGYEWKYFTIEFPTYKDGTVADSYRIRY